MTDHQPTWPDSGVYPDPTAAPTPAGSDTAALPHLPQQSAPYRVEPVGTVADDVVPGDRAAAAGDTAGRYDLSAPSSGGWSGEPHRALVTTARGPRPGPMLFGVLSMLLAAYVLVINLSGADLDLGQHLPVVVGGVGALLLVVGLVGVVIGRRHR